MSPQRVHQIQRQRDERNRERRRQHEVDDGVHQATWRRARLGPDGQRQRWQPHGQDAQDRVALGRHGESHADEHGPHDE